MLTKAFLKVRGYCIKNFIEIRRFNFPPGDRFENTCHVGSHFKKSPPPASLPVYQRCCVRTSKVIQLSLLVQLLSAKNRVDSALCDTSVKVGRHVLLFTLIVLSHRAIAVFACGCHGNQFKAKFTCFHKNVYNLNCIALISLKLAPS